MQGFKSFGDRTVSIKLAPGFTCIVGPNGAGKSNVIDALCFCLGRMSKKTMRAKALTDLIFAGTKTLKGASSAMVAITFDNTQKEFPVEGDELEVERTIKMSSGTSTFKMNGKTVTREQILNVLCQGNIDPDGSNQFVLQGKIVELTHMNTIERRQFIETLIGLEKYDQMKDATLKELEKADKDLGKFEAIFKEVSTQLKKYEKEKNDALRWKELDELVKQINAQLIAKKIEKLKEEESELEKKMDEYTILIQELEQKQARQKEKIEHENLIMSNLESQLSEKNTERTEIESVLSTLKSDLSAKETELKLAKDSIVKLEDRKQKLEGMQERLDEGQSYDFLIDETNVEIERTNSEIGTTHQSEDETDQAIKEKDTAITQMESEKADLKSAISKHQQDISSQDAEINVLNKNIKKAQKNLKSNEDELKKLKKEGESIAQALKNVQNEISGINQKTIELKNQIEEDKKKQKELEVEITGVEKQKAGIQKRLADNQSTISSIKAEIKMLDQRIVDLGNKKIELKKEYERLSGGKGVEEALKTLHDKETTAKDGLNAVKKNLEDLNAEQKKKEQEKLQLESQRRSLENEITDYKSRLSSLQTELGMINKNLKTNLRDKANYEMSKQNLTNEINKIKEQLDKVNKKEESGQKRLTALFDERKALQDQIKISENEYQNSQTEVNGVLSTLGLFSQNISASVGDVKSDIQNASEQSLGSSINVFKGYIEDFIDILKPIEELTGQGENVPKDQIDPLVENLKLFTEDVDDQLHGMISNVKEANDIAVQESTSSFDNLINDFMDMMENINVSLKRLTLSRSAELHNQLEQISEEIQNYTNMSAQNLAEISKLKTQTESKSAELANVEKLYNDMVTIINEMQEKVSKGEKEQTEKNSLIEQARKKQDEVTAKDKGLKEFTDNFWKEQKRINAEIDKQTEVVNKIQDDLRELRNIQRYLDDMDALDKEAVTIKQTIESKNKQITEQNKKTEAIEEEIKTADIQIDELKGKRDEFWQNRQVLDKEIDQQNELLKKSTEKMRGLENVQRILTEIEGLKNEISETEEKIAENQKNMEVIKDQIAELDAQVATKEQEITGVKDEKEELRNRLKELRTTINDLNSDLQKQQKRLNELSQMKDRAKEIQIISDEINENEVQIGEFDVSIQELYDSVSKKEEEKSLKNEEIQKVTTERDKSWQSQKKMRDELNVITASWSAETANLTTSKNKQATITEKIEGLFTQSKEFGTLPAIPPNVTEETLIGKIQKAANDKKALEPVNLLAIEYYDEVKDRFDEIDMRRQTLQRERKAIMDSLDRIELEKQRTFFAAFHEINRHFSLIFQKLSPGGSARMILENPEKPFEAGITIEARPRGKKISSLDILSGGEKTLVALAFIFAVQTQFPAPFYVMDEIDAALDGPNVHRVSTVIKEFAHNSQFLVISHREENIMNSEMIYGVSQADGLTSIFSVNLQDEKTRMEEEEEPKVEEN
jgi:chromosome segregation protein